MIDRERWRRRAAPILLGSLVGSLLSGRIEVTLLALGLGVAGAVLAGAGTPRAATVRMVLVGGAVAIALNLYLTPGVALPLPRLFGAWPTREGFLQGLGLALRLLGAALALHGLAAAWPGERAADELADRLRLTEKLGVPVRRMRAMVALALRFVPLVRDEADRVAAVQRLRAGSPARSWATRFRRARAVVIPTLVSSLERAGQLALALEARHFRLREPPRLPRAEPAWRGAGWAMAGLGLLWR